MNIHTIRTGTVRVREVSIRTDAVGDKLRAMAFGGEWTPWMPINAWAVEHPDGLVVVDTGETAKASRPGHFPSWHPYFRRVMQVDVKPEDEIGPQLGELGLGEPKTLVLTHLHTDHAGGLHHFAGVRTLVSQDELDAAKGIAGRINGYLPLPDGFAPEPIAWRDEPVGPFERSAPVTSDGAIRILPAPGHTPGHVAVLVDDGETRTLLAGDAAYTHEKLAAAETETRRRINALGVDRVRLGHEL